MSRPWLTDETKAALLRRVSAPRLLWATLLAGALAMLVHLVLLAWMIISPDSAPSLGVWPAAFMGPVVCAQLLRFRLIERGWAAVCCHELQTGLHQALGWHDGPAGSGIADLPAESQANMARHILAHGWISWARLLALAGPAARPASIPLWMVAGGTQSQPAGPQQWSGMFDPVVWRHAQLEHELPVATKPAAPRPRL